MYYGFYSQKIKPKENITVTFYDKSWDDSSCDKIMCFDATLKKKKHKLGVWTARFQGQIYTKREIPERYFNPFIGANTYRSFSIRNVFSKINPKWIN